MTESPRVSIVIPVFEGLRFLGSTLQSIRDQSYPNIEVVVVDGGSHPKSLDAIRQLAHDADHFESLPQGTPVETTWTVSCELATGEFVKLLCQDDLLYPQAITSQVEALARYPQCSLAFARRDIIDAQGSVIAHSRGGIRGRTRALSGEEALLLGYRAGANIYGEPLTVLFRTEDLIQSLPWDASNPYLIDMSTYYKCMLHSDVLYLNEVIGAFRVSDQSWSTRMAAEQTRQFREWQRHVATALGGVSLWQRWEAAFNAHRVSWMRSIAYGWLGLLGRL